MIPAIDPNSFRQQVERVILRGDPLDGARPVWCARAPGRIDFMGGNVDYTGGLALQIPTRESIWAIFQPSHEPVLRIFNPEAEAFGWATVLELPIAEIGHLAGIEAFCEGTPGAGWGRYVFGAFHLLRQKYGCFTQAGGSVSLVSDLPPNRGVASSAALVLAVLMAASGGEGILLNAMDLVTAAQWVENVVVRSACGVMDQAAIVFGAHDSLLPILCQPCSPSTLIALPPEMRIWGVDSMVRRSTQGDAYEAARAAAFMGYKMICQWEGVDVFVDSSSVIPRWTDARWQGYLSRLPAAEFRSQYEYRLPESMTGADYLQQAEEHLDPFTSIDPGRDYPVRAAARYAVEEHRRCETVRALIGSMTHRICEATL
jgi:L-arabinokinase